MRLNQLLDPLGIRCHRSSYVQKLEEDRQALGFLREKYRELIREALSLYSRTTIPDLTLTDEGLELLLDLHGTQIGESFHLIDALRSSASLPGDVCEFGVARGTTSALIAHEIRETEKHLWLFDSFEGLPAPSAQDELIDDISGLGSMQAYQGTMAYPQAEVRARLERVGFPGERTHIVPGFIEEVIETAPLPEAVGLAFVDFDFYSPIATALRFLARSLVPGGWVLVDDYGFFSSGAKKAVDEFLAEPSCPLHKTLEVHTAGHFCVLRRNDT